MSLIVQKYGGTSVGSPGRIKSVAARVARTRAQGRELVIVVSAMGHTTDQLLGLAREIHPEPPQRELDMLLTAGERISMALLAMALRLEGVEAISFTGSQSGIITDSTHGQARILEVRGDRIRQELARGRVVIVAGFQGVSREREITTLGRGGSDASAVALAGTLGAECCEIYTDVPGVMSADPRVVPGARLLPHLDFRTALTLTSLGAGVLMPRAAALGFTLNVPILVRSSSEDGPGTRIDGEIMEARGVLAVTRTGPVTLLEPAPGAAFQEGLRVVGLCRAGDGGAWLAAVSGPEADVTRAGRKLAEGDLVSLVSADLPALGWETRARAAAARCGAVVLASFAGPGSISLLVGSVHSEPLVAALHEEFLPG